MEQEGVIRRRRACTAGRSALLGVGSIGQEMIRRAAGFGLDVVVWSRRFDGEDRPMSEQEARDARRRSRRSASMRDRSRRRRPADVAARADILSLHLALGPEHARASSTPMCSGRLKPGAIVHQHRARRGRGLQRRSPRPCGTGGFASGSTSSPTSRLRPLADFNDDLVALAGVYGTHHIGASTDQAQEAIAAETVRIVRSFKETGKVPTSSTSRSGRRPRTCSSCATATGRACSRTSSTICGEANLNVQETENIVFEGAEAAVARINLDGAPSASLCDRSRRRTPMSSTSGRQR